MQLQFRLHRHPPVLANGILHKHRWHGHPLRFIIMHSRIAVAAGVSIPARARLAIALCLAIAVRVAIASCACLAVAAGVAVTTGVALAVAWWLFRVLRDSMG